jgi:hypothetical protein
MTFSSKTKTYFEQVPLEVVKKIAKADEPRKIPRRGGVNKISEHAEKKAIQAPDGLTGERLQVVNSSFDIFQLEPDGTVLWQGLAPTVEDAKALVKELQLRTPSQYMIVSLKTGSKLLIDLDASRAHQTQPSRPAISN